MASRSCSNAVCGSARDHYKRLVEAHGDHWRLFFCTRSPKGLRRWLAECKWRTDANALTVTEGTLTDFLARFEVPAGASGD